MGKNCSARHSPNSIAGSRCASSGGADMAQSSRMDAVKSALLQPPDSHLETEEMVALLLAACSGAFDALPQQTIVASLRGGSQSPFVQHLHTAAPQLLKKLKGTVHISTEVARELDVVARLFVALQAATST